MGSGLGPCASGPWEVGWVGVQGLRGGGERRVSAGCGWRAGQGPEPKGGVGNDRFSLAAFLLPRVDGSRREEKKGGSELRALAYTASWVRGLFPAQPSRLPGPCANRPPRRRHPGKVLGLRLRTTAEGRRPPHADGLPNFFPSFASFPPNADCDPGSSRAASCIVEGSSGFLREAGVDVTLIFRSGPAPHVHPPAGSQKDYPPRGTRLKILSLGRGRRKRWKGRRELAFRTSRRPDFSERHHHPCPQNPA